MDLSDHKITCDKCNGEGDIYRESVYGALRAWREKLGLTQRAVAQAVGIADNTQLSRFESGRFTFSEKRIRKLVKFYRQPLTTAKDASDNVGSGIS